MDTPAVHTPLEGEAKAQAYYDSMNEPQPHADAPPPPAVEPRPAQPDTPLTPDAVAALAKGLFPQQQVEEMKAAIPDNVRRLRASDRAAKLYPNTDPYASLGLERQLLASGSHPAEAKEMAAESSRMLADMGLPVADARTLLGLIAQAGGNPVTEESFGRMKGQTHLRQPAWSDHDIALAHALLKRDARTYDIVVGANLHWHPAVVEMLVHAARQQRIAGRL